MNNHEMSKKIDGITKWMKGTLPQFDWLVRQKENLEYHFQRQAVMEKEIERLERRIEQLEKA